MDHKRQNPTEESRRYLVFIGLSILVIGLVAILYFSNPLPFQRFLGSLNPLPAFVVVIILGFIFLRILLARGWFVIYEKGNEQGIVRAAALAVLFCTIMILVDEQVVFSADMNILFPESLLFYPAIGFFVEILFHVLPLSILLLILTSIFKTSRFQKILWFCILLVSLPEPVYQVASMASSREYPFWALAYVGLHVYLINLSGLFFFKRYDFVTMYAFRLFYYLLWHIGWGYFRLEWLF